MEEMEAKPEPPRLDGVAGMFHPVYWYLARPSALHPQMSQAEVDACDVSVVAMYLGVMPESEDPDEDEWGPLTGDFRADAARINARRIAEAEAKARQQEREEQAAGESGDPD